MTKDNDSNKDAQSQKRVYRASQMHRRRLDKTQRQTLQQRTREAARIQADKTKDTARVQAGKSKESARIQAGTGKETARIQADKGKKSEKVQRRRFAVIPGEKQDVEKTDSDNVFKTPERLQAPEIPKRPEATGVDQVAETAETAEKVANKKPLSKKTLSKQRHIRRIVLIVVGALVLVALVLLGLFSWNRWLRYDDAIELQGEWFAAYAGRRAPIVIDGDTIEFNPETKWHYTLDTTAKTIAFSFGSQEGGGRYRFAEDHQHLIIEDGMDYSAFDTFIADLQLTLTGKADYIPQGDTITVLSRSADAITADAATAPVDAANEDTAKAGVEADATEAEANAESTNAANQDEANGDAPITDEVYES